MNRVHLTAIELQAFRGFAGRQRLDLDADVVLIRGDNGVGKTSIVDGLLWLFCGELVHLTERVRGLRRGDDLVLNRYSVAPATVRLSLLQGSARWIFERQGLHGRNELYAWRDGVVIPDPHEALARVFSVSDEEHLQSAVTAWGVLRQDAVRAALDAGSALHERLAAVVGLDHVTRFVDGAHETATRLGRERTRLRAARDQLRTAKDRAERRLTESQLAVGDADARNRLLAESFQRLAEGLPSGVAFLASPTADQRELADLGARLAKVVEASGVAAQAQSLLVAAHEAQQLSVIDVEAELAAAQLRAEEATRSAPAAVQLATAALDLLGDKCPVCGQAIDEASVRAHLNEMVRHAGAVAASASDAQLLVAQTQAHLARAMASEEQLRRATEAAETTREALREHLERSPEIEVQDHWLLPERCVGLNEVLQSLLAGLRSVYAEAGQDSGEMLASATADVSELSVRIGRAERDVQDVEARCRRAASLETAAREAATRIVERALHRLEPSFADVFDRLAPHATFTELRARQDTYYNKNQVVPEVFDPERRITANPLLVLSEGQLNVVALSYFLGLALNAREAALPFIVLDDPLQLMDVVGVLGFADLCRRIREQRQLVVTTHDRRFAEVLSRKLAPREKGVRTIIHEFEGWTRDGPVLESTEAPLAEIVSIVGREAS